MTGDCSGPLSACVCIANPTFNEGLPLCRPGDFEPALKNMERRRLSAWRRNGLLDDRNVTREFY